MPPFRIFLAAACFMTASAPVLALNLYDPASSTLPSAQGWTAATVGTAPSVGFAGGLFSFDTTADMQTASGYARQPTPLDTLQGFVLSFDLQVLAESHGSDNRAGFSLLVQGSDETRALELGFWTDRVWALDFVTGGVDGGYLRGQTAFFDTSSQLRSYTLTVQNDLFSLAAGGNTLFSGAMRDYPTVGLSTLPYAQSNFLFLGDNSSRGAASVLLGSVMLTPVPEPGPVPLLLLGLVALGLRRRWA